MELRWDWKRNGIYAAYDPDGNEVATVSNMIGPAGASIGWQIWLNAENRALEDYCPDLDEAQAATAIALRHY